MGAACSRTDFPYDLPSPVQSFDDQSRRTGQAERESYLMPSNGHVTTMSEDVQNCWDNFLHGAKIAGDTGRCLGYRPTAQSGYEWLSYSFVKKRALNVASAFTKLQLPADSDGNRMVGIYATNRVEWVLGSLGASASGACIVTLYDTLGAEAVVYCINQAELSIVLCDTNKKAQTMLQNAKEMPSLKHIVMMKSEVKEGQDEVAKLAESTGVKIIQWDELEKMGENNPVEAAKAKPEDLFIVCYTSGTTGNPKGVMLTHKAALACPHAVDLVLKASGIACAGPNKTHFSYLPLAHIFEQAIHVMVFLKGGAIGFFRGNTQTLLDDIKVLKPHLFPVVPRLLSRLYDKVQANLAKASGVQKKLFDTGYNSKLKLLQQGIITKDTIWDKLIFSKLQAELGGNVEFMVTGAAPISSQVLELCRVALGCVIVEGYGQTECGAACSLSLCGDARPSHVGPPLPCNTVKLFDVPEMNYLAKENKGEVCIRGNNVMKGYYKEPEKTAEALDADGWLHTGDVGEWLPNGTLRIIDRKKHIFKLAQGEYVAPEKIEGVYTRMPLIAQIFVDGISTKRQLVAVVVPEETAAKAALKAIDEKADADNADMAKMCANENLRKHILAEMTKFAKANKLNGIEQVRAIHLEADPFTVENDLLTPTMKSKRPQLRKKYMQNMEAMYKELGDE